MSLRAGFTLGEWTIFPLEGRLAGNDGDRHIQPKSMDVLLCLADAEGTVVERDALLEQVWGGRAQTDEPLTRCIGELRKALGDTRTEPRFIATIPKRGYRLLKPAVSITPATEPDKKSDIPSLTRPQRLRRISAIKKLSAGLGVLIVAAIIQIFVERTFEDISGSDDSAISLRRANVSPKSVAVLPFADLSEEQDQGWFTDGLAEEVLNALTHTPDLLVLSRTSAVAFQNSAKDAATIAEELGVAHVLQGSVRRVGDRFRVTAQLVRASDGFHVWSQNYDRGEAGVIEIQEDLALQIATALKTTMDPDALANMVLVGTRSVEAYQDYIRGIALSTKALGEFGNQRIIEANEYFERARRIDPGFSAAHRQTASFWIYQLTPTDARGGLTELAPPQMLSEFLSRINLAIDSSQNEINRKVMMATKARVELRLRDAIQLYKDYLQDRPNDIFAWQELLRSAMYASDRDTVMLVLDHYESIGDSNVLAAIYYMGNAYKWVDPSRTADFGLAAIARWPNNRALQYQTHRSLLWALRVEEAVDVAIKYQQQTGGNLVMTARQACAEGRRDDVLKLLADRREAGIKPGVPDMFIYQFLAEHDQATNILRQFESDEVPFQLATFLHYHFVDPRPFPALMDVLERENIERPAPTSIPFACPTG